MLACELLAVRPQQTFDNMNMLIDSLLIFKLVLYLTPHQGQPENDSVIGHHSASHSFVHHFTVNAIALL